MRCLLQSADLRAYKYLFSKGLVRHLLRACSLCGLSQQVTDCNALVFTLRMLWWRKGFA
jgi:hypothetical protein